jgi:hypothetical protein
MLPNRFDLWLKRRCTCRLTIAVRPRLTLEANVIRGGLRPRFGVSGVMEFSKAVFVIVLGGETTGEQIADILGFVTSPHTLVAHLNSTRRNGDRLIFTWTGGTEKS